MSRNHSNERDATTWIEWRNRNKLSQIGMSMALGMSRRGIQYIESGEKKPNRSTRAKFRELQKKYEREQCQIKQ